MLSEFLNGVYDYYKTYADLNRGGNPDAKKGFYAKHKNRRTAKKKTKKKGKKKMKKVGTWKAYHAINFAFTEVSFLPVDKYFFIAEGEVGEVAGDLRVFYKGAKLGGRGHKRFLRHEKDATSVILEEIFDCCNLNDVSRNGYMNSGDFIILNINGKEEIWFCLTVGWKKIDSLPFDPADIINDFEGYDPEEE